MDNVAIVQPVHELGRLTARPRAPKNPKPAAAGTHATEDGGWLFVPAKYKKDRAVPLLIALHGRGGDSRETHDLLKSHAEREGILVLAPKSRGMSWDAMLGMYGPDVKAIDERLSRIFRDYRVDPKHIALAGFSDGGSYSLSLGRSNGDLFTHLLAFSPGFSAPLSEVGKPKVFLSHGKQDNVIPLEHGSGPLARTLKNKGYEVRFTQFVGGHAVPEAIVREGIDYFLGHHLQGKRE